MPPTFEHTQCLLRHFERQNGPRAAKLLFDMARQGVKDPMSALFGHPLQDEWHDFACSSVHAHAQKRKGIVYVAGNPVNRGVYKVGHTGMELAKRLSSLNSAGVIGTFIAVDQAKVWDRFSVESQAHRALSQVAQRHKEFFVAPFEVAGAAVRMAAQHDNGVLERAFGTLLHQAPKAHIN